MPGDREDRADRDERVRRRDDDRPRRPRSPPRTSGVGRAPRRPRNRTSCTVGLLVAVDEVLLELEPAVVGQDLGPDRLVGHRQDRGRDAERAPGARGRRRSGGRRPEPGGPRRCASRGRGRRAGTTSPRRSARASPRRRTSRPRCPSPHSRLSMPGERVHDGVVVGHDEQPVALRSSPVLTTTRQAVAEVAPARPVGELRAADAAGERDDPGASRSTPPQRVRSSSRTSPIRSIVSRSYGRRHAGR